MREFFKPWRRKLGVVTLVLTCVFIGPWVRSLYVMDTFVFSQMPKSLILVSVDGAFGWQRFSKTNVSSLFDGLRWHSQKGRSIDDMFSRAESLTKWHWNGFGVMQVDKSTKLACIPYWFIVLPLTLVSAWLLLSKPRQAAPKHPTLLAPPDSDHA